MVTDSLRVERTLEVLRSWQASVTVHEWFHDRYKRTGMGVVELKRSLGSSGAVIAQCDSRGEADGVAYVRRFVKTYGASMDAVVSLVRGKPWVSRSLVAQAAVAGWGERVSKWFWFGWDPEAGDVTRPWPGSGQAETWVPVVEPPRHPLQPVLSNERIIAIPRATVADPWSVWSVSAEDPHVVVRAEPGTPADKVVVARFTRVEDAAFMPVAREAIAQFGPVLEAVRRFAYESVRGELDSGELMELMESTPPWPLRREPRGV